MITIKILNESDNPTPTIKTKGAAGFDIASNETKALAFGSSRLISTGIKVIIPEGYEGQLRLRSSMYDRGFVMPNAPGTIDSDYRGEVKVPLVRITPLGRETPYVEKGERIAQLIIKKLPEVKLEEVTVKEFSSKKTSRGSGGFGSTGTGIKRK